MYAPVKNYEAQRRERPSAGFDVIETAVGPLDVRFLGVQGNRLLFERTRDIPNDQALADRVIAAVYDVMTEHPALAKSLASIEAVAIR